MVLTFKEWIDQLLYIVRNVEQRPNDRVVALDGNLDKAAFLNSWYQVEKKVGKSKV